MGSGENNNTAHNVESSSHVYTHMYTCQMCIQCGMVNVKNAEGNLASQVISAKFKNDTTMLIKVYIL